MNAMPRDNDRQRQIPLELDHVSALTRDDLIVSASNEKAVRLIEAWPDWSFPVTVLVGPASSGKTHLAAIWQGMAGARAIHISELAGLDVQMASDQPVLIEDLGSSVADETGLFHLINAIFESRQSMMITSRMVPALWTIALADLRSRLKAATCVEISTPDDDLLRRLLVKLFADRQITVDRTVVEFLVARMERSFQAAYDLVEMIDQAALIRKVRITRKLAGEILGEIEAKSGEPSQSCGG